MGNLFSFKSQEKKVVNPPAIVKPTAIVKPPVTVDKSADNTSVNQPYSAYMGPPPISEDTVNKIKMMLTNPTEHDIVQVMSNINTSGDVNINFNLNSTNNINLKDMNILYYLSVKNAKNYNVKIEGNSQTIVTEQNISTKADDATIQEILSALTENNKNIYVLGIANTKINNDLRLTVDLNSVAKERGINLKDMKILIYIINNKINGDLSINISGNSATIKENFGYNVACNCYTTVALFLLLLLMLHMFIYELSATNNVFAIAVVFTAIVMYLFIDNVTKLQ